jgi:hypothetical protein
VNKGGRHPKRTDDELIAAWNSQLTREEICVSLGMSADRISTRWRELREQGRIKMGRPWTKRPNKKLIEISDQLVKLWHDKTQSAEQIAITVGISVHSLKWFWFKLRRQGLIPKTARGWGTGYKKDPGKKYPSKIDTYRVKDNEDGRPRINYERVRKEAAQRLAELRRISGDPAPDGFGLDQETIRHTKGLNK